MKRTVYTGSVQEFRANSKSNVQNGNPSKTDPVVSIDQNQKQFYEIILVSKKNEKRCKIEPLWVLILETHILLLGCYHTVNTSEL